MTREIPLSQGKVAVVDDSDFEWLSQWKWCIINGYAARRIHVPGGKAIYVYMHRLIMGVTDPKVEVDHRNSSPLINTRDNLRIATRAQQCYNTGPKSSCISGLKGVHFDGRPGHANKPYYARITVNGQTTWLGYYETPEGALDAYNTAAAAAHGEFARLSMAPEHSPPSWGEEWNAPWIPVTLPQIGPCSSGIPPTGQEPHYRGVRWIPKKGQWRASIHEAYRFIMLGYFDTAREAALCVDAAARYYFGPKAPLNLPFAPPPESDRRITYDRVDPADLPPDIPIRVPY